MCFLVNIAKYVFIAESYVDIDRNHPSRDKLTDGVMLVINDLNLNFKLHQAKIDPYNT